LRAELLNTDQLLQNA
jgi:excinuclease UvrABC helicase subunit UvrB